MKSFIIALSILLLSPLSFAGPRIVGNGGDTFSLQFLAYAEKVQTYLENSTIKDLDVSKLGKAIETTKVESTDKPLLLNGIPKDAINYPQEKKIIFNRDRWVSLIEDEKLALVLHEYLGLIGIEDAKYTYSKLILKDMTTISRIRKGGDSMWVLCQDDTLVVNLFEHRAEVEVPPNGEAIQHRTTEITLIYGGWVLTGELRDEMSGNIKLTTKNGSYAGQFSFDYMTRRMTLSGALNLAKSVDQLNMTMQCEEKYRR